MFTCQDDYIDLSVVKQGVKSWILNKGNEATKAE